MEDEPAYPNDAQNQRSELDLHSPSLKTIKSGNLSKHRIKVGLIVVKGRVRKDKKKNDFLIS